MISVLHYISAGRRLKEAEKTVYMMGGETECPEILLAQRDMIELEVNYYAEESRFWALPITITIILGILYSLIIFLKGS
jgi:hypothetical protein